MIEHNKYSSMSSQELIDGLTQLPVNESLHSYFYNIICLPTLNYISNQYFGDNCSNGKELLGEFYEHISAKEWNVLRKYKGKDNAKLSTYIASCAINYFISRKKKDDKHRECLFVSMNHPDIVEELNNIAVETTEATKPIMQAIERLNECDKQLITQLYFKKKSTLETAEIVWPLSYHAEKDWRKLPTKKVQDTISRMKSKALMLLVNEYNKLGAEQNTI